MVLCDNCVFYKKEYDSFRQNYDDIVDGDKRTKHYCPMYDDHIPHGIFYNGDDCPFHEAK